MAKRIDLILDRARGGEENMALDRAALARAEAGQASLRIYRWDRPSVTLGKNQEAETMAEIFPELPTVVRPSGGGAVLHGFDVTLALAMPLVLLGVAPRELRETYFRLIAPLAESLYGCGLACHLAQDAANRAGPDCFSGAGRLDLLHDATGRKVAGCALVATRAAALLHASIPHDPIPPSLGLTPEVASRYMNPPWREKELPDRLRQSWRDRGFDLAPRAA
ncbi:lipoate--protein ligase family protein [bacterium]|nr:MAG: lipoate--protein ligase family protein [bacterium]